MSETCKQSYAKGPKDDYEPAYRTAPEFLCHQSNLRPDKIAFVFLSTDGKRQTVTWKQLYTRSVQIAKSLIVLGVKREEVVAISVRDSPEWLIVHCGIIMAAAIPFGLSFMMPDGSDVISLLKRVNNCSTIFLDPGPNDVAWNIFKSLVAVLDDKGNVTSSTIPSLRYCVFISKPNDRTDLLSLPGLENMTREDINLPDIREDDIQMLFQSSGSTGAPRLIAHTHKSLTNSVRFFKLICLSGDNDDVVYNGLPFRWMGGYMWNMYQGETRVTRSGMPENMSDFVFNAILQERVTYLFTLPSFVDDLMKRELPAEWPLRTICVGGQPIAKHFASCLKKGVAKQLSIHYASSEATSVSYSIVSKCEDFIEYTCGKPFPGVEVKVVNNRGGNGEAVPPYVRGELCIRSEGMFKCYYNDEANTKAALSVDGWYKSGDAGYMTDKGVIYVEGRTSDTIVSGGVPVSPAIMETFLNNYDGVKTAMLVPVPDNTLNLAVCTCFVPEPGSDVNEESLRLYLEKVSADKVHLFAFLPKYFMKFDAFPQTHTGKVSRTLLSEEAGRRLKL